MRFRFAFPLVVVLAAPVAAHPLTEIRFDRTVPVRVGADRISVRYRLELSPLALQLDAAKRLTTAEIAKLDKSLTGLARAYAAKVADELREKLHITADGKPLRIVVDAIDVEFTHHVVCEFRLNAAWPPGGCRPTRWRACTSRQ